MERLAFLGLGVMGTPMARHLAQAGHDVCVFNRSPARAQAWVSANHGTMAATPREAAQDAVCVFACVADDAALRAICLGSDGGVS